MGGYDKHLTLLQYQTLLENIQGGIVYSDCDPPFKLRYVTEGLSVLSGHTQEELLGMTQMNLVHPDDIESLMQSVGEQFAKGDFFEVEYRLLRKDKSYVHVLDRAKLVEHGDGKKYIHCVMTDITDLKNMESELRLSQEKYKLAMKQSGLVIIEYTPQTGELSFSENCAEVFCEEFAKESSLEKMIADRCIFEDDVERFKTAFKKAEMGEVQDNIDIRLNICLDVVWCSMSLALISSDDGEVYAVLGQLRNIDETHKHIDMLRELSTRDPLTGILNRSAMEELVNEYVEKNRAAEKGLLILDIDDFKSINDKNGHDFGDDILLRVTQLISGVLPERAFFGRLGGDEFVVFVDKMENSNCLVDLADDIRAEVFNYFAVEGSGVTISVGGALYSKECCDFYRLYRAADKAMYKAKNMGRNRAIVVKT